MTRHVGADKACDAKDSIAGTRALKVTAHVQKNEKGPPRKRRQKDQAICRLRTLT